MTTFDKAVDAMVAGHPPPPGVSPAFWRRYLAKRMVDHIAAQLIRRGSNDAGRAVLLSVAGTCALTAVLTLVVVAAPAPVPAVVVVFLVLIVVNLGLNMAATHSWARQHDLDRLPDPDPPHWRERRCPDD